MCGINGVTWQDKSLVQKMNQATSHRGPDATGVYSDQAVTLGNNRLSIIDLDPRSNQPMIDSSDELVITYNGEIYNFKDLKKELSDYNFKTESDTEVILAAYRKWGTSAFKRLNGMYAFALWDKAKKELLLVRDPVGIKPLFYFFDPSADSGQAGKLIFSSEIKGILEADIPRFLNQEILTTYLRILYVPEPFTAVKNIYKLPPGHFAVFKEGKLSINRFYVTEGERVPGGSLREVIERAVKRQLVSDRPVGVYLSGGFDSSVVLSVMSKVHSKFNSYSVGFSLPDPQEEEKFNADFNLARKTAKFFGANHHELKITPSDVRDNLERIIGHCDALVSNPTSIPMALLAEFTRRESVVVLSGDGGDELFGGYERYQLARLIDLYAHLPGFLREVISFVPPFKKLNTPAGVELYERFMFQKENEVLPILGRDLHERFGQEKIFFKKYFSGEAGRVEKLMLADFQSWLPDQALLLADQMSMSASLEQRVPLLDLEVVRFVEGVSRSEKVTALTSKKILREAFRDILPAFLFGQPKRGWFSPGAKWLRDPAVLALAGEILSPSYYRPTAGLFGWGEVAAWLDDHVAKRGYHLNTLWAIITFQIWARQYRIDL